MLHRLTSSVALVLTLVAGPAAAATVDGIPLHWSSSGSGSRTVMLIHGWTCDSTSSDAQMPALAKQYRVTALDLPGHGKSGSPASGMLSMELFARAVEAVRSEAGADKVVLVGHSMGTPVIREYARLYPQRVTALVAVGGMIVAPGGGAGGRGAMPSMNLTGPTGLASSIAGLRRSSRS